MGWSLIKRKVRGLVPCCGKDGYRAELSIATTHRFIQMHITYQGLDNSSLHGSTDPFFMKIHRV